MTKKIRQSVFETNSSSTHSISIAEADPSVLMDVWTPDEEGNITLNGGEFGWDPCSYGDVDSKASYMAIYALDWSGENKEKHLQVLLDVLKEQTGCKDAVFNFTSDFDSKDGKHWSYIDHQSVEGHNYDYVFEDPELLRQFIFNPNSILYTDNDNH